jgi:hypothetical protein
VADQAAEGFRDGKVLAPDGALTVASDVPVDDSPRRTAADMPTSRESEVPEVRAAMQLPSAAERVEAHEQTRVAADRAYAKRIGEEISSGHAFDKHVVERGEFPGVTTREQFASLIEDAVINGESRVLNRGRTAYWSEGTVVIRNPSAPDGGTTFRPPDGYDYFLGLK